MAMGHWWQIRIHLYRTTKMKSTKVYIALITLMVFCTSCLTPYRKVKQKYFDKVVASEFQSLDDFEIFTFNICESYKDDAIGAERFIECPDNFYDISASDELIKVEELYFLKKKNSSLVLYATSYSHKYIGKQKGFLNDRENYENQFYLKQTEFIYVGRLDDSQKTITFQPQNKNEASMIWHLNKPLNNAISFKVERVNIETVENRGSHLKDTITIDKVFQLPLKFRQFNYILKDKADGALVKGLYIVERKNKKEIIFETVNPSIRYRFPAKIIRYYTD